MKTTMGILEQSALLVGAMLVAIVFTSCGSSPPDDILDRSGQAAIVFVRENSRQNNQSSPMRSNIDEYYSGSDLFLLSPISTQGTLTNLTAQYTRTGQSDERNYGAASDPEISYDGTRILFAMKTSRSNRWRIYETKADGTNLVQLTEQSVGDDMDPTYLPNGQIMFTSTRSQIVDEYERRDSPLLHVGDRGADGKLTNIRQVSFNQSHDANPMVHSSGKIIYSRWEHLGNPNKFALFVMNPDGTRPFIMYGNHSPREASDRAFMEARELSDGGLICSLMERTSPFEGGAIAIVDISKSDDNLTFITPADAPFNNSGRATTAFYKTPHPIIDKNASSDRREKILVAMSPIPRQQGGNNNEGVDYGIYVLDKDGSNLRLIYNDPNYNEIDPVPVLPRDKMPGGVPQVIATDPNVAAGLGIGATTGMFFDGNVYDRATNDGQIRPSSTFTNADGSSGQAKYVRVLEAIPLPHDGNKRGQTTGNTNLEKQRVTGYATVRSDGSFSIEVPANRSLHIQTLDQHGMLLTNQVSWTHVMPGEKRLCTGCHDSHDRDRIINDLQVQPNNQVLNRSRGTAYESGFNNAELVTAHPAARTDTLCFFDRYRTSRTNTVQSVFDRRCISCHDATTPAGDLILATTAADLTPPPNPFTNLTTTVYERLTRNQNYRTATNQRRDYVNGQSGSRQSPFVWVMFGRQLDDASNRDYRTLSYDHTALWTKDQFNRIDPFIPANRDLLMMIEWIDMGIQFSNTIGR
jgi:hypothetical protein